MTKKTLTPMEIAERDARAAERMAKRAGKAERAERRRASRDTALTQAASRTRTTITTYGARRMVLSALLIGLALYAFRLSFDAQTMLAYSSGIPDHLAYMYPLIVDGFIVVAYLVDLWTPGVTGWRRAYPWVAIALFTAVSIAGNAHHVSALPPGRVTVEPIALDLPVFTLPIGVQVGGPVVIETAVLVNTVPAVALLVAIHLAASGVLRPVAPQVAAEAPVVKATAPAKAATSTGRRAARVDGEYSDAQLLELKETGGADGQPLSLDALASKTGIARSTVSDRLRRAREVRRAAPLKLVEGSR